MANGAILGQSTTTWTNDQILSSVSAALYSLGANATPDQVFAAIRPLITTAQNTANNALSVANGNVKIVTGSYVGAYPNPNTITFPSKPKLWGICFKRVQATVERVEYESCPNILPWLDDGEYAQKIVATINNTTPVAVNVNMTYSGNSVTFTDPTLGSSNGTTTYFAIL